MPEQEKTIRLFIESPAGDRSEANVPEKTLISRLASDFLESQQLHLKDRERGQRAVIEWVNPNDPDDIERLDDDLPIWELGIRNGDTLRITPEVVAGCFSAGTKVSLPDGRKLPIEQLEVGDLISSYSFANNSVSQSQVVEIFRGREKRCLLVNGSLSVTPSHLIRINGTWQRAANLRIGDHLSDEGGAQAEVLSIEAKDMEAEVFNVKLRTENSFFAENILVSDTDESLSVNANFFADGLLVNTYAAKLMASMRLPVGEEGLPDIQNRRSLREWWHKILRDSGRYSCYAIFLLLPSDKEATKYFVEFGDELDLITASDCLVIVLGKNEFHIPSTSSDNQIWSSAINQQITEGHSLTVADFFGIDYDNLPCVVLFRDIRSPRHLIVSLKGITAEEIAVKMRGTFSVIHRAVKVRSDPLVALQEERNKQVLLARGESIVSGLRILVGKTFETGMQAWIKAVIK